jgi:DNA adenine methylase
LKWAGGKRWLVPNIELLWKQTKSTRLVEPFCGGLSVALGILPAQALLNDINPHLINFFRQLKEGLRITIRTENDSEYYYSARERFNGLIRKRKQDTPLAAKLFYYLNRTGFNGLCRFNKDGFYNVPFGSYLRINYQKNFLYYKSVLSEWEFQCEDFEKIKTESEDFIYSDPPYDASFQQFSKEGFSWDDQERLVAWLVKHPGPVVASNCATERICSLYENNGFQIEYLDGPRRISCTGNREPVREILATRNIHF